MKISLLCASALLACSVAPAAIIITQGNDPGNTNILFNDAPITSSTDPVVGKVNESLVDFLVQFDSSETLEVQGGGQSRVQSTDGLFSDVSFMSAGNAFTSAVFKLQSPGTPQPSVTFTVNRLGEPAFIQTVVLGNSGFISIEAVGGQLIEGITIETTLPINDIRQVRLGGFAEIPPPGGGEVPEPMTMGLLGAGLGAIGLLRRNRNR
jgi:hypothetical protein